MEPETKEDKLYHTTSKAGLINLCKARANKIKQLEAERSELVKENERLKNDLLDALDLKEGEGPTALSMQAERIKELEELLKRCESHIDMEGGADELIKELKAAITK